MVRIYELWFAITKLQPIKFSKEVSMETITWTAIVSPWPLLGCFPSFPFLRSNENAQYLQKRISCH